MRGQLVAFVLALIAGPAAAGAGEIHTVAVNNAPPYRIIDKTKGEPRYSGIYIDVIKEAAKRAELRLQFVVVPFKRALVMMEQGAADIMLGPNLSPEREVYMAYLDVEMTRERKAFYLGREIDDIAEFDTLFGVRIAVLRGAKYFPDFDGNSALKKYPVADYLTAFRLLAKGRVDAAIMPELLGDSLVRANGFNFRKGSYMVEGKPSFITVSRKSPLFEHRNGVEMALREMAADGTVEEIVKRYRN